MPSVTERFDAFQRRHPSASFPLAVVYKFADDQGPYLAALITYYGFLSLFPLLLLLTSILGFVLDGNPDYQRQVLDSTLSQFPVIGEQLGEPQGLRGSIGATVTGALVAVYGALGVAQAMQNAMNVTWSVPRHRRPNPIRARLRSLALIGVAGVAVLLTTVLSAVGGTGGAFGADVDAAGHAIAITISTLVNGAVFVLAFRISKPAEARRRDVIPGAIVATFVWQLLQIFGAAYVGNVVKGAGAAYGVFALVLGLIAWIYLAAAGIVLGTEINAVRAKHLYPRSLLTPFTDDVDLTSADQRAYADAAHSQQFKGFESVTVSYQDDGQHRSARRRRARAQHAASQHAGPAADVVAGADESDAGEGGGSPPS